jgi:hypothetical protein
LNHPVAHDLQRNAADPGRRSAARAVVDRHQCQQSPYLRRILAAQRPSSHLRRLEIGSERDRHDEPPAFATLESEPIRVGQATRVAVSGNWYAGLKQPITFIGLDVHKDTVVVALVEANKWNEVREYGKIANTPAAVKTLVAKLARNDHRVRERRSRSVRVQARA